MNTIILILSSLLWNAPATTDTLAESGVAYFTSGEQGSATGEQGSFSGQVIVGED